MLISLWDSTLVDRWLVTWMKLWTIERLARWTRTLEVQSTMVTLNTNQYALLTGLDEWTFRVWCSELVQKLEVQPNTRHTWCRRFHWSSVSEMCPMHWDVIPMESLIFSRLWWLYSFDGCHTCVGLHISRPTICNLHEVLNDRMMSTLDSEAGSANYDGYSQQHSICTAESFWWVFFWT